MPSPDTMDAYGMKYMPMTRFAPPQMSPDTADAYAYPQGRAIAPAPTQATAMPGIPAMPRLSKEAYPTAVTFAAMGDFGTGAQTRSMLDYNQRAMQDAKVAVRDSEAARGMARSGVAIEKESDLAEQFAMLAARIQADQNAALNRMRLGVWGDVSGRNLSRELAQLPYEARWAEMPYQRAMTEREWDYRQGRDTIKDAFRAADMNRVDDGLSETQRNLQNDYYRVYMSLGARAAEEFARVYGIPATISQEVQEATDARDGWLTSWFKSLRADNPERRDDWLTGWGKAYNAAQQPLSGR